MSSGNEKWEKLKSIAKKGMNQVKQKVGEFKEDKIDPYIESKKISNMKLEDARCPLCNGAVHHELLAQLTNNGQIICEYCGASLSLADFQSKIS